MNRPHVLLTMVAVVGCSVWCLGRDNLTAQVKAVVPANAEWEYKLMDDEAVHGLGAKEGQVNFGLAQEAGLNKLGEDGWELITVSKPAQRLVYFFKRPKTAK